MSVKHQWILWVIVTICLTAYFTLSLTRQPGGMAKTFLPGVTTHGHYQIEMQCMACHTPGMGVKQESCVECHGADLKRSTDTHPRSKFTDPGKMHLLTRLDARHCTTCHQEHVPDRTLAMGLSLPSDYCWHCHQEIGEQRPSHADFAYDSCATAGCHNYHDNRALFENFLAKHHGEPAMLEKQLLVSRTLGADWLTRHSDEQKPLSAAESDPPGDLTFDEAITTDWAATAHAAAGVNCTGCHTTGDSAWTDHPTHESCQECHESQVVGFLEGRHGMRLAQGLSPMTPATARLPMHEGNGHAELTCSACHTPHKYDTAYAAVDACVKCHADEHSTAYLDSSHYQLWQQEQSGEGEPGSGVSCATCHLPRLQNAEKETFVQHNQNDNLRPNEKMVESVCHQCHGLQFSLDALADETLIKNSFQGEPATHVESLDMAKHWFDERARKREEAKQKREGG